VARADYADDVAPDCERVSEGTPRWRRVALRPGRPLRLTVRCAWAESRPCKGIAWLQTTEGAGIARSSGPFEEATDPAPSQCRLKPGRTLAKQSFRTRAGRVKYVDLRIPSSTQKLVRGKGCVAVLAGFDFTDADGRPWRATRSLVLKRPGLRVPGPATRPVAR
jgi:hypothetical protein